MSKIRNRELRRRQTDFTLLISLSLIVLFCPLSLVAQSTRFADLVVFKANVRTMTSPNSVAEALAVSRNRITSVGTNKLIRKLIGPSTHVIDAGGRLVLPGFNDAHVHFMGIGNTFSSVDLRDVKSPAEIMERIGRHANFLPDGRWILGGHFNDQTWKLPDRQTIDAIAPNNPIFLYRTGAAAAFANRIALNAANVKEDDPDVDGVTGIVKGAALKKISGVVPRNHTNNWLEIAETATNYAASLGVTSVHDMHSDDSREIYLELQRNGKLKTRVYDCLPLRDWKKLKDTRLSSRSDAMVTDGCLKSFSDGDLESKPALTRDVAEADRAGLQLAIHAIGRDANKIVLDVFEQVRRNGPRDRRQRVEHAHNVRDEDLHRFSRFGIIASMQPFLFEGRTESRFGTLLRQGAAVAFGSDASMVDLNPLLGIAAAVNAGSESISIYEAVRAYTVTPAYAEFAEKEKGTIERGRLADFVILSDDIFAIDHAKIVTTRIMTTVVDGKVVYRSN